MTRDQLNKIASGIIIPGLIVAVMLIGFGTLAWNIQLSENHWTWKILGWVALGLVTAMGAVILWPRRHK